jgi:hypothetical protein
MSLGTVGRAAAAAGGAASGEAGAEALDPARVVVLMACSLDYLPSYLCIPPNRAWAARHGYAFQSLVSTKEEMLAAVHPRDHLTWFKVLEINRLLAEEPETAAAAAAAATRWEWVVWIDADATVVLPDVSLDTLLQKHHVEGTTDLIIGEDVSPSCKVNAGVMLIRNTEWSRRLWADVWACPRWRTKAFHEQSAVCRWLKANEPGFGTGTPWYSWDGAPNTGHRTEKTLVLPHPAINTNGGSAAHQKHKRLHKITTRIGPSVDGPAFVFHAIGCSPKLGAIREVLQLHGVPLALTEAEVALLNPRVQAGGKPISLAQLCALGDTIARDVPGHLVHLALDRNGFDGRAAVHISTILKAPIPLRTLDLSFNNFGDVGIDVIADAVGGSVTIEALQLERAGLTEASATRVLSTLQTHPTLHFLDLSGNGLHDNAAVELAVSSVMTAREVADPVRLQVRHFRKYPTYSQSGCPPSDGRAIGIMW